MHAVNLKELMKQNDADRVLSRPEWEQLEKVSPQKTEELLDLMRRFYEDPDGRGDDILNKITKVADEF